MKKYLIIFLLLNVGNIWSQQVLNQYKYVIVPKQFSFQKGEDSYRINSLTKFLLNKKQFKTIFENDIFPEDLSHNHCLGVRINLLSRNNIIWTRITVEFLDCQNKVVFKTEEGGSKLKTYLKAYNEAIRNAFKSLDKFEYKYIPRESSDVIEYKPRIYKKTVAKATSKPKVKIAIQKHLDKIIAKKHDEIKKEVKTSFSLEGLYKYNKGNFEIAVFKNYYIFSKRLKKGDIPLGFIYKTSQKGNYLVRNSKGTFTSYLKDDGSFVVDEISDDGTVKSVIYKKSKNQ